MKKFEDKDVMGKIDRAVMLASPYITILFGTLLMSPPKDHAMTKEDYLITGLGAFLALTGAGVFVCSASKQAKIMR